MREITTPTPLPIHDKLQRFGQNFLDKGLGQWSRLRITKDLPSEDQQIEKTPHQSLADLVLHNIS